MKYRRLIFTWTQNSQTTHNSIENSFVFSILLSQWNSCAVTCRWLLQYYFFFFLSFFSTETHSRFCRRYFFFLLLITSQIHLHSLISNSHVNQNVCFLLTFWTTEISWFSIFFASHLKSINTTRNDQAQQFHLILLERKKKSNKNHRKWNKTDAKIIHAP